MNHCDEEIENQNDVCSGEVRRIYSQHSGKDSHGLMENPHFLGYIRINSWIIAMLVCRSVGTAFRWTLFLTCLYLALNMNIGSII